ncbi:unnamed protein product [Durusdinium trenchii]|uniref:Spindle pole body-associated protein Vik1/Cik1 microtubule binding domain-containing protein n=1 Tax=Durusdinium trenchii TaxID=1381693 RepID=A0ABP0I7J2_9DINO
MDVSRSARPLRAALAPVVQVPPIQESPMERLRLAVSFAKRCGVEDQLVLKAEAFIKLEESRKQAIQLTVSKVSSAFERAKICQNLEAMKEIKEQLCGLPGNYPEVERLRRRVHNAIEDLKGHLRVFCRVRPLSQKEQEMDEEVAVRMAWDAQSSRAMGSSPSTASLRAADKSRCSRSAKIWFRAQ